MATALLYFALTLIGGGVVFWLYRTLVSLPAKASSARITAAETANAKRVGEIVKEKEDEAKSVTDPEEAARRANRELDRLLRHRVR